MTARSTLFKTTLLIAGVASLAGCASVKNMFGSSSARADKKASKPAELVKFKPSANFSKVWSINVGKGGERAGLSQAPAVADGHVYAAAVSGGVQAYDLATGKQIWKYDSKARLSGGPGAGQGLVVVGGLDGEVIALDAATGAEKWTAKVINEVITAPAIGNGVVVVRSNDGRLTAFDMNTGERRWNWSAEPVALSVRGNSAPLMGPGAVFTGTDSGKLVALGAADGGQGWEATVADPDGRNELQRMVDVDGTPVLEGSVLYASSYKGRTVAVDGPSGQIMWAQEHGGAGGVGVGATALVVSDAKDVVWALDKSTGAPMWSYPELARRSISAPAVLGDYAVVGDYDGYLHWFRMSDGQLVNRLRFGGGPIRSQPVVANDMVIVQNSGGEIAAFRAN